MKKPDLVVITPSTNKIGIFRNRIGENHAVELCPPIANTQMTSTTTGTNYQWQEDGEVVL
jgi:hypothetical protein